MDGNTRFARTFRIKQYTIDALVRIAETQTRRAVAAGQAGEAARCTLTDALELAVMRAAATDTPFTASRPPTLEEARDCADAFARLANTIADALDEDELADAPPADEMLVLEAA